MDTWANDDTCGIFYIFLIHFAKLYDRFKFLQIWQPTVVRHGGRSMPRWLGTNCRYAWRLEVGHDGWKQPTVVGSNRHGPQRQRENAVSHDG
jgi:hypothetical protein